MGRRKIEIKAIKDDRNRSVTFLKRKGGLFKKAHELSVLCSVDVAVFIFGQNKKLYEYSSCDMRELITRYTYHGGPNEHKGPNDFNGGGDDEDEDENGTPQPHGLPQHFHGQPGYPQLRHHTPSASPPVQNGMVFQNVQRAHTPQPGSRPGSRNDMRRMASGLVAPQGSPYGPPQGHPQAHHQGPPQGHPDYPQSHPQGHPQGHHVNGYAYVPQPAIYNPQNPPNSMPPSHQYPHPPPPPHMQMHMEQQRQSSMPPNFPPHSIPQQPSPPQLVRHSLSPPQHRHGLPTHGLPTAAFLRQSPPPQQRAQMLADQEAMPAPNETKTDQFKRASLDPASAIKKMPQRKQHSIFTPIEENRSVLSQHLAAFTDSGIKSERSRVPSFDGTAASRNTASPPQAKGSESGSIQRRRLSVSPIPEQTHTPPSRANSLRVGGPSRPRLTVQIPDEPSEAGSNTAESTSAGQHSTDATSQTTRNDGSHSSGLVLPPPSPSAATNLLSAGATGPPNPFARPPPNNPSHTHSSLLDTPASALPSRYMANEFLPSPSQFFADAYTRHHENNTLPSPLNFATPVVGSGPSFLRDEMPTLKRKSPEMHMNGIPEGMEPSGESKRLRADM